MADVTAAYAAGLFDGEGCVYIQATAPTRGRTAHTAQHHLGVKIAMTDDTALCLLASQYGGAVRALKLRHNSTKSHLYEWAISGHTAAAFLVIVRPYVRTKALEVWLALEFMATRTTAQGNNKVPAEELALREGFKLALQEAKRG